MSFFSMRVINVQVVLPYSGIDRITTWMKSSFILSERTDLQATKNSSAANKVFIGW